MKKFLVHRGMQVESLLDNLSETEFDEILEARKKRKKKIKKQFVYLFWPFFGKDGHSAAEISTGNTSGTGNVSSPAYPGAGGINSPGVPAGPNSGMGPS